MQAGLPAQLAALIAATAYGANIVGARLAADAGIAAPVLVFYRVFVMAGLVGALVLAARRMPRIAAGETPAMLALIVTSAAMGIAYLSSVAFIPVTVAAVIFYTYPILIVLTAPLVTGERARLLHLAVAIIAFAGILLVVGPSFDRLDWRGLALAGFAAVLTAVQFFAANRARQTDMLSKIFFVQLGVMPIAFGVMLMTGTVAGPAIALLAPAGVALATIGFVIGFAGQMFALTHLSATVASLIFCLEPVVAALVSAWLLGERLSAVQYAGGALVIAAVIVTVVARAPRKPAPAHA